MRLTVQGAVAGFVILGLAVGLVMGVLVNIAWLVYQRKKAESGNSSMLNLTNPLE